MEVNTAIREGFQKSKIGWIPKDWGIYTIGKVVRFSGGSQPPRDTFKFESTKGYIRLIQTRDYRTDKYKTFIKLKDAKKFCTKNDIMIGRYGPPLFQLFRGLEGAYNVALIKAIPDESIVEKEYMWQFFNRRDLRAYLESLSQRSGGQTGIEMDRLKKYHFPIPPRNEQLKISQILSAWDQAISNSQELVNNLKNRKKGLMQQLLYGKKRLNGFNEDWKTIRIGDIAKQYNTKNIESKEITVLSCTKYDGLVPSLEYFGRQVFGDDISKYKLVPKGYFAYATNHIEEGSIGLQTKLDVGLVSPMYTVFKTNDSINDNFFFRLLKTDKMIYKYQSNMSGSIARRGGLRWNDFKEIEVTIPPKEEQNTIARIFDQVDIEIQASEEYLKSLIAQKKGLMQQLLTGQTRVKV